jgi:hypothetical protein
MSRTRLGIVEGGPHRGVAAPVVVTLATGDVVLVFPLPFVLTLAFAAVVEGGAARGHDGSCWSGRGGCYCCRGHPPLAGTEHNVEAYPWAAKLSSSYCVEGGELLLPLDEDVHVIEPLVQAL